MTQSQIGCYQYAGDLISKDSNYIIIKKVNMSHIYPFYCLVWNGGWLETTFSAYAGGGIGPPWLNGCCWGEKGWG